VDESGLLAKGLFNAPFCNDGTDIKSHVTQTQWRNAAGPSRSWVDQFASMRLEPFKGVERLREAMLMK
jgi:hypothetical protein